MVNAKKILPAMIAGALLCTGSVFSTVSAEESVLLGDLNNNGTVDGDDAAWILDYYNGTILGNYSDYTFFSQWGHDAEDEGAILASFDINKDGLIDCDDAVFILHYYSTSLLFSDVMTPEEIWEAALKRDPEKSYPIGAEKGDVM